MEKQKITIDFLQDTDNEAILKLSHRCPQNGVIGGYPDRSPEFRRIHKQLSDKSYHMVAREGDKLIGAFGAIYTNLHYKDQNFDSAYLLDLKVDPEHRRSTTAYRVVKETVNHLRTLNTQMAVASFLKDNEYSLIFTRSRAGIPDAQYLGDFRIFSIVPIFRKKVSKVFTIDHPTKAEIPELIKLYNKFYSTYKLAPRMDEELFSLYTNEIDGMDLGQIWVARQDGKIKATICAWDEDHYKRWFVVRMSRFMKFLSFSLKALGLIMKMPAPIRENTPFKHISLVLAAHDDCIDGMRDLLRSINNFYRGKEYTILQTHFHNQDPLNTALKGLNGFSIRVEAHVFTEDKELARRIAEDGGLVHFEWPM
ncbi:MAG: GNAT family N-acetyltransferase, partial [Bacteroidales bacterium]|nr:GNAT family N-acetyltransferase [Bacteroidales bacterium]